MCGLFAQLGAELNETRQQAVLAALQGRGPDDRGLHTASTSAGVLTLLHTRLAIQDLSPLGHQPMAHADGQLWLVFNGEIYNQRILRQQLEALGEKFRGHSDTEVLLAGYRQWGDGLWGRLNGIFALVLWDECALSLILARDGCGVKPLLWQRRANRIAVASELSAFEAAGLAGRSQLCAAGLESYALWGAVAAPYTLLAGVEVFPAGHWGRCQRGIWTLQAFKAQPEITEPLSDLPADLPSLLAQVVARQSIGDRPVGLFLSGGLDSGLLAALLRRQHPGPIHSLAMGFTGLAGAVDETDLAGLTAAHLGLQHQRLEISPAQLAAAFDPFMQAIDQPSIDGFNSFLVAQAASANGMVVAFSGLGADELFYGYKHMAYPQARRRLACRRIPASGLAWFAKRRLLQQRLRLLPATASGQELQGYLRDTLLRDSDAVTMAQGLELRVPFLDPQLVDFAQGLSAAEHLSHGPKTLLRQVAAPLLPTAILRVDKRGFNLPLAPWLLQEARFAPQRLLTRLQPLGIPASAIWRSWALLKLSHRRWAPYWRWLVLAEWLG
jgi:asparagine synthase (glutamine-hydrolysing)